ncbi:MAG: response regulator [Lentisphaeria bacterium]|nr:response regulator [Lentisphaeria bacterium]
MQGYTYSVFSVVAIAIHLIINFNLLTGRRMVSARGSGYRGFLVGTLAYYITDALWGIFAGLGWTRLLYVETIFFFLSLVAFAFMWCRFVIDYLCFGRRSTLILSTVGYALWVFNLAALAVNPWNDCFFHIDAAGIYHTGWIRDPAFYLLVGFNLLIASFVLAKAFGSRESLRRRSMMVFMFCITMAAAIMLQVIWPLTPFTSLGCLVGNCFLHVFIIEDEQTARHIAELGAALDRARTAEKARSLFFSIVSHDIRTPLNAILGYSELLQDGIENSGEREEALRSIRASGTTLLELVNDVLDLAKMDSGKMMLHPEPVRLSHLTDEVFASFRLAASGKGIELVDKTAGTPPILLDEHRFRQILFNLIGNAVKFTEKGSVTVTASYADTTLDLAVADTGCGIPPDMLTRVLEPFVQVGDPSHAADRSAGGTGLGLSICKRLVEAMGGELTVESELGKGSIFRIRIPGVAVHEGVSEPAAPPKLAAAQAELPKRVLVVDDSPVNRKVLTAFLKKAGVTAIDHACDGAEALKVLDSAEKAGELPDLVLSDLWMPNMNGLEFIEKLRADGRFDRLPVFAVTADTEFRRDMRTCFFTGILLKPVTYAKLLETFAAAAHVPAEIR